MREIKFRAWDKDEKRMTPAFSLKNICFKGVWDYFPCLKNFNPHCVMQYTGLKDKKGKEIYEGDIIKCGKLVTSVKWVNGGFWSVDKSNYGGNLHGNNMVVGYLDWAKGCGYEPEVIGNIYENPELTRKTGIDARNKG